MSADPTATWPHRGHANTPSTATGTRANDAFNALVRGVESTDRAVAVVTSALVRSKTLSPRAVTAARQAREIVAALRGLPGMTDEKVPVTISRIIGRRRVQETIYVSPDSPLVRVTPERRLVVNVTDLEKLVASFKVDAGLAGEYADRLRTRGHEDKSPEVRAADSTANAYRDAARSLQSTIDSEKYDA